MRNKSKWNYRVMSETELGSLYLTIRQVYYDQNMEPITYSRESIIGHSHNANLNGETIDEIKRTLNKIKRTLDKMKEAVEKPILWADDDKFPNEYKPNV